MPRTITVRRSSLAAALAAAVTLAAAGPAGAASDLPATKGASLADQHAQVEAQWAAARAPDTASADAAKKRVLAEYARKQGTAKTSAGTARDTAANRPRHGALTQSEESNSMPKAGQVNNHSSPALEADSGRPSK